METLAASAVLAKQRRDLYLEDAKYASKVCPKPKKSKAKKDSLPPNAYMFSSGLHVPLSGSVHHENIRSNCACWATYIINGILGIYP